MLNYIWAIMIMVGVIFGAINGNMKEITEAALSSAGEAVTLCITMIGVMSLWVGLMEIAQNSGLIQKLTHALSPFISFMFPDIPKNHKSRDYISTNIIANILGLGWACTPAGLKAMEALAQLEQDRHQEDTSALLANSKKSRNRIVPTAPGIASKEMCTFLILNISSLQLIPVNMIVYRSQYGSANATAVIAPAIIATLISTFVAIIFCKIMEQR